MYLSLYKGYLKTPTKLIKGNYFRADLLSTTAL